MTAPDPHGLGYVNVDNDPSVDILLDTMDATSAWEATRRLRAWEQQHLEIRSGQRVLDVGCGQGDALIGLAAALGTDGQAVGLDASVAMLDSAVSRAAGLRCPSHFIVGDAAAIAEPSGAFDVVRAERVLQWVREPVSVVDEMVRVLRPGGLLSLIDTDWSSLRLDIGDDASTRRIPLALEHERRRPSNIGRRLRELVDAAGLAIVATTAETQRWTDWDPDTSPTPAGCFSMASLADDLVETGHLDRDERDDFIERIHQAARAGHFSMTLTMHAVIATR